MKNLNLINPERRLGGHDFCGVNHANQTEVQTDNLSVSGRSKVSMTLDEQPCNHPVITPLSPSNHPLLPKQKSGKSLIRIGKNVAESHVRKYAGASRVWKYAAMVVLMVTLGVGQMWAEDQMGFENSDNGVKFSKSTDGGSSYSDYQVSHGRTNTTQDGGSVTNLYLKEYFVYLYQNVNNLTGTTHVNYWFYRTNIGKGESSATQFGGNWGNWKVDTQDNEGWKDGWRHPKFGNDNISNDGGTTNVNLLSGQGSGHYTFEYYFDAETNGGWSTLYCSNTNSENFKVTFTYNIVPAVSSYSYSTDGSSSILSGSGTSEDPYIISYNGSLKITQSGSKASADANSDPYYKFGDGAYGTSAYTTINNITSTSKTSIEVKMKYYNSTDDLSGTESTATIYYKAEPAYSVTINNDGHGTTSPSGAQSNVGQVSGIAISATPSTNYEFVNWTITSGTGTFTGGGTTSTSASTTFYPTSAATIQANFRSTATNSLTVSAGTHVTTVSGSTDPVTLGSKYAISATAFETGYEFLNWTAAPAANAEFDNANSASTNVTVKNGSVTVTANAREIMHTVSITGGTGSSSVGIATQATVTAATAAEGKKFDHWDVTGTYTLQDETTVNSREIHFTATSDVSLTAVYADRASKTIYFARPSSWTDGLKVYAWQESTKDGEGNPSNKNAAWPGEACSSTTTIKGTTYYCYTFYTDDNGEGDNLTAQNNWDKIIFSDEGNDSEKTSDLTIANGHFYHKADGQGENERNTATVSGSASAEDWYVCGYWNASTHDWGFEHPINLNGGTSGNATITGLTASTEQQFKIYRASTDQWFKWTGGASADDNDNKEIVIGEEMTLREYNNNRNTFTSYATEYLFTLDITSTSNPVLTVAPNDMTEYSTTLSIDGHGSLDKSTGTIQLKEYVPTTITATPETSYRFKQWTVTGGVVCSNTTSATATFTTTGAGGTITAEFTNDEVIYFDAGNIENEWGDDVYVTFLSKNFEWNDGDGKDGALIVKNWVDNALRCVRMNRIPNTRIFYLDYSNLSGHESVTQYVFFTSKYFSIPDKEFYRLYDMAAVTRGDYNKTSGNNMCVAENFREKDKNKTGYYCGYWMNYNDTKAGIRLKIYGGTGDITEGNGDFTLSAAGSRTYTATVSLSANTTYRMELQGYNDTYYKNNGTMVSTNCTAWPYVDRQATVGHITTTAGGEYKFILNCADKLYLTADFPLAVNDYKLVFSGKVAVGGIDETYSSSVIRHIGDEGTKKDTLGFFVVNGDSWTLQLKRCTSIDPITWVNVGDAKTAANFGTPATGIYNFVVKQDSTNVTPVIPAFATMTPEAYTGNYYIRTDAADGGWEAYKKALDNQMIFSNYAKSQSNFDYYHCRFANNGINVKFCIANDYSARLSDTLYTDTYAATGEGILPADANVRFMWNSQTNVCSRAYLNGSSTTDFLLLEAKGDSLKNFDGTAISGDGDFRNIKFKDMGNWIYQKEVQALPGTRVRLTSNYRFDSADHIQYFKGESGEWDAAHGANTDEIIGGTTNSWERLRLVYDFKTNHLTSAWLPPTDPINDTKSINADMLLIRRGQNAAQQLTFGVDGKIANVKTIVGAMEFVKDSIVGRVSNFNGDVIGESGNRANRELMHYISFPFDVAVNDIYGFGQLNKEWYLQYYDGADRAAKGFFRGDGTTTFWKFMTLSDTLRAGQGYSLLLDNDYFNTAGDGTVWKNIADGESVYLYFPSVAELPDDSIIASATKTIRVPEHKHTSGRTFEVESRTLCHDFTDSDWNMMGVPLFQNQTGLEAYFDDNADPTDWPGGGKGYFYEWDSISNNFEIHTAEDYIFKSMHGYMVQYSGEVSFTGASIQPASSVVARRAQKSRENYTMELQLLKENKRVSRTYIELREEACDTFALNEDVYMVYTSHPADLYTYAGNYDVSANVLSMDNHSIPVGIEVHKAGSYTFSMPENFSGSAVLVDTEANTRTNLALSDYTVTLPKGICDGRFYIEIDLNKIPTAIDGVEGGSLKDGKAHKFIENGAMYILRDGVVYDARGTKVK